MRNILTIILVTAGLALLLTSCQKEIKWELNTPADSTAHIVPMMKITRIDVMSNPQDSIIHLINTQYLNGQKTIIVSEVDPQFPGDSMNSYYKYNAQGRLIEINTTYSSMPAGSQEKYTFTWNSNKLMKIVYDTLGVFSDSWDLTYTPAGANTDITITRTPPGGTITPTYIFQYWQKLTVDPAFNPVKLRYISYDYIDNFGTPDISRDTTDFYYSYTGADLSSYTANSYRCDTSGPGGSTTNYSHDTLNVVCNRSNSGNNICDSLKQIFGSNLYTLMNFEFIDGLYLFVVSFGENDLFYYAHPQTSRLYSNRVWPNGVFDPGQSYSNLEERKIVNSFDSQNRLIRSDIYQQFNNTQVEYILKITY